MAQQSTEYGRRAGNGWCQFYWPVAASEVFKKKGGSLLVGDANGRVAIATAAATLIVGHARVSEDFTASATAGATPMQVDQDLDNVYEMPINGATVWADTMRGKTCDISIVSSVQGVNLGASAIDIVELVDKGTTNPAGTVVSVLYKIYRNNLTRTGVV